MNLQFHIRYHTRFGQTLWITGNIPELGSNDPEKAFPLNYLNSDYWTGALEIKKKELAGPVCYKYILKDENGEWLFEYGNDREIAVSKKEAREIQLLDTWNHAGEYENTFYSDAFNKVLLADHHTKAKTTEDKNPTHIFKVKAPLLNKHEQVCVLGSGNRLGEWSEKDPIMMGREGDWWTAKLDLSENSFPIAYKYGIYNTREDRFERYEGGNNRVVFSDTDKKKITILHDGFVHLANNSWKGAGVAIPVFSLKSKKSFGVGEFSDIKLLVDWAKKAGLKLIQLLPVNDTTSNFTWQDSYPYSAISAFALHPIYINLSKVAGKDNAIATASLKAKQKELNELPAVDYEEVIKNKMEVLRNIYDTECPSCFESEDYKQFFKQNKDWLESFAAFSYFREKYGSSNYGEWDTNSIYDKAAIDRLCNPGAAAFKEIGFYFFVQYHLHIQLKEAVDYAHKKGIVLKGDIPIGISRNSCDAWVAPEMYNMCWQAGAPPDDFTAVGQNWGFPTYNWKKMQEDGFAWWKQRFEQMSNYFDAFRIDHILGFFRIWSIPANAVQGIMGRFVPCLPVHINEFSENGIGFDYQRYCRPYVTNDIVNEIFGDLANEVKEEYLIVNDFGGYDLAPGFESQKEVEAHFQTEGDSTVNDAAIDKLEKIKLGLFDLISNVILFEEDRSEGQEFHFRISMDKTTSFKKLPAEIQNKLQGIYINYFYRRQDDFWYKEAMHKLPKLKASTNMLICGEDLGMVPHCVPDVMKQLGILSLEIQRMPKDPEKEFFHPADAPYLSVITPSTHDMSTIRGWWEENRERTQHFYNHVLSQWGDAPFYCEPWINRAIVLQHLYSPAMWSIFQLQDILGMSDTLRRENPNEERINNPANPKHYWQYRMHLPLEELVEQDEFNEELSGYVEHSGRR